MRWKGLLEVLGRPAHVGGLGAGASMKLVANLTLGAAITAVAEALALADGMGLPEKEVQEMLADTPVGRIAESARERIESGASTPHFRLALAHKDLRLATAAGDGVNRRLPLTAAARDWFEAAVEAGMGEKDYTAVITHAKGGTVDDAP